MLDPRPAPVAIVDRRKMRQAIAATRSDSEVFAPLPSSREEVEKIAQLFRDDARPARILLDADAREPELDHLSNSGELGRFGVIHLATHE